MKAVEKAAQQYTYRQDCLGLESKIRKAFLAGWNAGIDEACFELVIAGKELVRSSEISETLLALKKDCGVV